LCVPLVIRDRVVGALTLLSRRESRFAERHLALCEELAHRIALALEHGRLHRKVEAARAHADEANRLKDEFLATLSHELRSPLSAVLTWSHMLRRGLLDEARAETALESIEKNARHQVRLIEDLLDVSRIVTGNLTLQTGQIDVAAVLHAAIETARAAAETKGVAVQIELAPVGPVLGDATRLQQVFSNLLSNAIKFTPSGGRIVVGLSPAEDGAVEITVRDDGIGIRAD